MSKIGEILGVNTEGLFGVEIECEGERLQPVTDANWNTVDDGSLRGRFPDSRCEWVMAKPMSEARTIQALEKLIEFQRANRAKFDFSFRTSTHVHVNVQDLEWEEYLAMIYTYLLIEEPLMDFCGEGRKCNRFCLRLQDSEEIVDIISNMIYVGERSIKAIRENDLRYAAINIGATRKYGSLEFRGMRGTLDINILKPWIKALGNLKTFSIGKTVKQVHEEYLKLGNRKFLDTVVGSDMFWKEKSEADMNNSYSLSIQIPYCEVFV